MKFRFYCLALLMSVSLCIQAQRTDREFVRKGNRMFSDSLYMKAEENYLKAIDKNSASIEATYNLGNTYIEQQKGQEAVGQYQKAITVMELDYDKLYNSGKASERELADLNNKIAQAYHNTGVVMQTSQNYASAVAAYKQSLRRNPTDHETRYNLALAMHQLKQQEQQDNNSQDKQDQQNKDQQIKNQEQEQEQDQEQQQDSENPDEMSQENAEQILEAAMQDEKDVQERVQKSIRIQSKGEFEKNW